MSRMTAPSSMLAALIRRERDLLLSSWRQQVRQLPSAKHLDAPTLNDHIPGLLCDLADALETASDETIPVALSEGSPPAHGLQRVADGYDIEEVVAEYNILRGCIHDLAERNGVNLEGRPFHVLNRVLDGAIGVAVRTFSTQKALEVQHRREEYLSFVAHDLRTPLNAISLAVRVLAQLPAEGRADAIVGRMLRSLHRNAQQLETLVAKILEENKSVGTEVGVKLERRLFDLWPLVEALIQDVHPVAGTESPRLVNQVPDELVVHADAGLLKRILQNLIANALRHTPRGEVVVGARELEPDGRVECWVRDNGTGIPESLLGRVFEVGETGPDSEDRSGLGLAIVRTFVEAHGGTVTVKSEEGLGSVFSFTLPRGGA
jgi:signal transduction histidine kinase